ncbi:hypothetical protein JCM14076_24580 [Methylosoma difficile]
MKSTKKVSARLLKKLADKASIVDSPQASLPQVQAAAASVEPKRIPLAQIVKAAKQNKEAAFGNVTEKRALEIARVVIAELGKRIDETQEGAILLPIFGQFSVEKVFVDGKVERRVYFQSSQAKKTASDIN